MLEKAARVTSSVVHKSSTGRNAGPAAGAAVIVVCMFIPGVNIGVGTALAIMGAGIGAGSLADSYLFEEDSSEKIAKGVVHVMLDEPKHQAANASEISRTDADDAAVTTGSDSVYIENFEAARFTDLTACGGVITTGSPHIFYGGEMSGGGAPKQAPNQFLHVVETIVAVAGLRKLPSGAFSGLLYAMSVSSAAEKVGVIEDNPFPQEARDAKTAWSLGKFIFGLIPGR